VVRVAAEEDVYVTETTYNRETGLPVFRRTSLNGMRESPPDDSPSVVHYDSLGRPDRMEWYRQGQPHREAGPSVIYINPENGVHVIERFYHHGVARDRALGPSKITRDHDSGEIISLTDDSELDFSNPATKIKPPPP
jgi:hypothetical protein